MSRKPRDRRLGRRGVAALEFALTLPILLVLLLGAVDAVTLLRSSMRIDRSAAEIANLVSQYTALEERDFPDIFTAAARIADPLEIREDRGAIVITAVTHDGRDSKIAWQRRDGASQITSRIGSSGTPILPPDLVLEKDQTAILVETFAEIIPFELSGKLLFDATTPRTIRGFAAFRPRTASLSTVKK